ncbi:MAG: UDP-N-acetylmuramoyl-L-alanine--D-glutamate ligase [Bdellovibrionales bacterium]
MQITEMRGKKVAIWGLGHEGKAAARFIHQVLPDLPLVFIDEAEGPDKIDGLPDGSLVVRGDDAISAALSDIDILVKSPGVSLYHPRIAGLKGRGVKITSLLNLWMAEAHKAVVICVTGTKGKSTTSALLAHTLNALGRRTVLGGNIGVPVAEIDGNNADFAVIEVSSYQAADFDGTCDIALLTSLRPEHLDWHGGTETYYKDKINLLTRATTKIINHETFETLTGHGIGIQGCLHFNHSGALHMRDGRIYDGTRLLGLPQNTYLARPHNLSNVCGVLTVIKFLGLDLAAALDAMHNFCGLPHRQQELGEKNGILYVNDSIATAPHAAIAAIDVYRSRPLTLIAGGYDRGVDYQPLIESILENKLHAVVCLGPSGKRIHDGIKKLREERVYQAATMQEAMARARAETPKGGVILLSPAAPSYGLFRDFVERGRSFAAEAGFKIS